MFKRRTVGAALSTMAISAAAFFGAMWIVPYLADSSVVYRDDRAYLPPVIQIPIFVFVAAPVLGGACGLLQIILILMTRLERRKPAPAEADPEWAWPPAPTAARFE